jgi:hypothetical protein
MHTKLIVQVSMVLVLPLMLLILLCLRSNPLMHLMVLTAFV